MNNGGKKELAPDPEYRVFSCAIFLFIHNRTTGVLDHDFGGVQIAEFGPSFIQSVI